MAHYRTYFLDACNRITGVEEADHQSDDAALVRAQVLLQTHRAVEVWTGTRWVDHLLAHAA